MATYHLPIAGTLDLARDRLSIAIDLLNRGEASFQHDLRELIEALQADRAASLEQARALHLAAQLLLQGEAQRLARRAPDDPRIPALAQGAQRALAQSGQLAREAQRATVRVPLVRQTEALLHGRITDEAQRAAGPVTVRLADADGKPVEGVAPVEADSAGYYALVVPPEVAARLPPQGRFGVSLEAGGKQLMSRLAPQPLQAGVVKLQDVTLSPDELKTLKLRGDFPELRPRHAPAAKAPAPRKGSPRHREEPEDPDAPQ